MTTTAATQDRMSGLEIVVLFLATTFVVSFLAPLGLLILWRHSSPQKARQGFRLGLFFVAIQVFGIISFLLVSSYISNHELHVILIGLFASAFVYFTPLVLAAIGGLYSERSGVINIGLEGIMLSAAFMGVLGSWLSTNPWVGLAFGIMIGVLMGFLYAVLTIRFRADQIIVGVAVNLVALGVTNFLYKWAGQPDSPLFGLQDAQHIQGIPSILGLIQSLPSFWSTLSTFPVLGALLQPVLGGLSPYVAMISESLAFLWEFIPLLLGQIPVLGPIFTILNNVFLGQNILVYLAIILAILCHVLLLKTPVGLRIRAVGENARAADSVGISVFFWRYVAVTFSGLMAGLGGAFLSLGWLQGTFSKDMAAGRGFIAIAAYIFGNWNVIGTTLTCLLFGVFYAFVDVLKAQPTIAFPVPFPLPNSPPFVNLPPFQLLIQGFFTGFCGNPGIVSAFTTEIPANLRLLLQALFTGFYGNPGVTSALPTVNFLSTYFVEMVPFILTIIALSGAFLWKSRPPKEVGKPYVKGGKD